MKLYNSNHLLDTLQHDVKQIIASLQGLKIHPSQKLQQQPGPDRWSVAQVLEHLNIYCRFYLHKMEEKVSESRHTAVNEFSPGWLGNYFTSIMRPQPSGTKAKKMKAPKNAIPSDQPDAANMLDEFIAHQEKLLDLLQRAKSVHLGKNRVPISIAPWITLKLGDTFRFFIAHEQRHVVQINNTIKAVNVVCVPVSEVA